MTAPAELQLDLDAEGDGYLDHDNVRNAYDEGWTRGHAAALAARPPATVLVPVPIPWRHVQPGDTFRAGNGDLWHINDVKPRPNGFLSVLVCRAGAVHDVDVDPDETLHVLHDVAEVDAITLAADQLGARLIHRRGGDPTG